MLSGGPTQPTDVTKLPRAHDLPSVIRTLNMMNTVITRISNGAPQVNNINKPGDPGPQINFARDPPPQYEPFEWQEYSRSYRQTVAYNPEDPRMYVEVRVVASVGWNHELGGYLNYIW